MVTRFFDLTTTEQVYRAIGAFEPLETERVEAGRAAGRVVAETVLAAEDVPMFDRSNMDGFAVRAADTFGASENASVSLRVTGHVAMGTEATVLVEPGCAVKVSTGAMLPGGADAVVMVEKTESLADEVIALREAAVPGQNLIRIAEDLAKGDVVFEPGRRLKGGDIGALTGAGHAGVRVYQVPRVGILVTGDEIVEPDAVLRPGQVRNVNEYSLTSLARLLGARVNDYGVSGDDEDNIGVVLTRAASENDLVLVSGGSSKGDKDLTRRAFDRLGADVLLHGIAIAPGKPTILARKERCALLGLPGNPAAAIVVFTLFCAPLIRVLEGERLDRILLTRPTTRARLSRALTSTPGREDYIRVRLEHDERGTVAIPLAGKSVAISTIARADGLLRIPLSLDGLDAGTDVEVLLF